MQSHYLRTHTLGLSHSGQNGRWQSRLFLPLLTLLFSKPGPWGFTGRRLELPS